MTNPSPRPERAPNPCYRQAYYRKKSSEITEAEYFHAIFMHLIEDGVQHKGDGTIRSELEDVDPLGFSLNCWITYEENRPKDSKPFENVFSAYRNGDIDEVRATLGKLNEGHTWRMRTSLALLALQERNAAILTELLDDGIEIEEPFEDEVRRVVRKWDPQTHQLLKDYAARKQRPWAVRKRPRQGDVLNWGM